MKKISCTHCRAQVFFENDQCLNCHQPLGFVPDSLQMEAFDETNGLFTRKSSGSATKYRRCQNGTQHHACNWMVPESDANPLCLSCRLNELIPNLADPKNVERWRKLEMAKRRCLYSLLRMKLPMKSDAASGGLALQFRFLANLPGAEPVTTGHADGQITVNIVEADEDERERRRLQLHEPYRTLVGHFRHELGHFYWDCLIKPGPKLTKFRELFGDETADYGAAMQNYYQQGPTADWPQRTITAYASMHPWEDWAETWAQYFHIKDTLESFDSFGLKMIPAPPGSPQNDAFDTLCLRWVDISCALNAINRSMGLSDLYPFIIPPPVREKLHFIDQVIAPFSKK